MKFFCATLLFILITGRILFGQNSFRVQQFHPFANLPSADLVIGEGNSIAGGFHAPSTEQCATGLFEYQIRIQNSGMDSARFYYQIFYAKETKPDSLFVSQDVRQRLLFQKDPCVKNGFHLSEKIAGNSNQLIKNFFSINTGADSSEICRIKDIIRNDSAWFRAICLKARQKNTNADAQLYYDALYVAKADTRKKENKSIIPPRPETGIYKFLLLVFPESLAQDSAFAFLKGWIENKSSPGFGTNAFADYQNLLSSDIFCGVSTHTLALMKQEGMKEVGPDLSPSPFLIKPVISYQSQAENSGVTLKGKTFFCENKPVFPVITNYIVGLVDDGKEIWPCASEYYTEDSEDFPRNKWSSINAMSADFELLASKGIHYLRITGLGETDKNTKTKELCVRTKFLSRKSGTRSLVSDGEIKNYLDAVEMVLDLAYAYKIRVILLVKNVFLDKERENMLAKFASRFSGHPGLMAYDFFNEPLYFEKDFHEKKEVIKSVSKWNEIVKKNAPNQLTTIGLVGIREVFEWDPSLLPVDFVSFHPYEFEPEQVRNEIYWYGKHVKKPWIIGETAIPADNIKVRYQAQKKFAEETFKQSYNCGASGYSWWQYKDVDWNRYHANFMGMLNLQGTTLTANGYIISGTCKPIAEVFRSFSTSQNSLPCSLLPNYYNYSENSKKTKCILKGKILDKKKKPVSGAVIMVWNKAYTVSYHTVSLSDGSFELKSPVIPFQWIASYSKMSTAKGWFSGSGSPPAGVYTMPDILLEEIR